MRATISKQNHNKSVEDESYAKEQDKKLIDFIKDADVLIIDSQYDATEYESHVGWGHSCVDDSVELAIKANVKRIFLFHHDPVHNDEQNPRMTPDPADVTAITQVILLERECRDMGRWERMRQCFNDDSLVRVSWLNVMVRT